MFSIDDGRKQLFSVKPTVRLAAYYNASVGAVETSEVSSMPFIRLPNGAPCLAGNAYMIHLYKRGLSRRNGGGTLRQYAADISHLIRYCSQNNIDLMKMDSSRFTLFVRTLRAERDPSNPQVRRRESNTLNAIGRKCLDFLDFVSRLNGEQDFVSEVVKGYRKQFRVSIGTSTGRTAEREGWHHECFDTPGPQKKRGPISKKSIDVLYQAVSTLSSKNDRNPHSNLVSRRRIVMLRLLEMTGARVAELASVQVDDIESAIRQLTPMLRLVTLKGGDRRERFVPVMKQDLVALKPYVRFARAKKIKQTIGTTDDHGFLFISETTGKPLTARYMSNEIGLLRRATGLSSGACAHMFRHRFITKLFVRLINQFEHENKDDFRKALLDTNTLKQEVQQYTGHKLLTSLDHYIDLAFEEVTNLRAVKNSVGLQVAYESFDELVAQLHRELEEGLSVRIYLERYQELEESRRDDVERLSDNEPTSVH